MKIFHFISTKEPRACGVLTAANTIFKAQIKSDHKIKRCISLNFKYLSLNNFEMDKSNQAHYIKRTLDLYQLRKNYKIIKKEIERFSPDIVHLHSVYSINNYLAARVAFQLRIPYVLSPHGGYAPNIRTRKLIRKRLFEVIFERWLIKNASEIFVVSDNEVEYMQALPWHIPPIGVVNNPLPFDLSAQSKFDYELKSLTKFTILYIGRLDIVHKGIDLAIRALSALPLKVQKSIQLYFVTPIDSKKIRELQKIAVEAKLKVEMIFCGPKFGSEKLKIIKSANILFLTSRWEAFGYTALEAMASGIPVLVTNAVPLSFVINKVGCGWVCSIDEQCIREGFKRAIALNSMDLKRIGNRGIEVINKDFDPYVISERLCSKYKQIINQQFDHAN